MSHLVHRLRKLHADGVFAGMGYAALLFVGLMLANDLTLFVRLLQKRGLIEALHRMGSLSPALLAMLLHPLLMAPLIAAVVNLLPTNGVRRYVWLTALGLFVWFYCTMLAVILGAKLDSLNEQGALMITMIIVACVYRSAARTTSTQLVQRQTESATLDAEVKRASLQLLRAQIEPHFLFNTLATVRTLGRIDRCAAIDMLENLMRYLSEALPKLRQEESSLAEELQLVDAYLKIHQIRMGTRLSYELQVPTHLRAERIPTMILLTLVENAVKHGINPTVEGGLIRVTAAREHTSLVLRVADSGQGLAATDGHGMGLANIRRRLTMLYGDQAVLSLARGTSRGVVATVSIPLAAA
jgi:sensor histidine kinase YesM